MAAAIEVFRDLYLRGSLANRPGLRRSLEAAAVSPWCYDADRAGLISRTVADSAILAFSREASANLPAASLALWGHEGGYYVPNIVPLGKDSLSIAEYNAILADFIEQIVRPVAPQFGYQIDTTDAWQSLEDWTSQDAAQKLRVFSGAANKSTGASHPMDQRRWFDFLIAVHRDGKHLSTDRLVRWLHEIDGWDEESAHELAGQYETALSLLQHYDKN